MKPQREFSKITVVNKNDEVIGYKDLFDALDSGDIRRVSVVYIFNEQGQLLLQRRADWVIEPDKLDHSAAGHVDEGDDYELTAAKELKEELGITIDLKEVGTSVMTPGHAIGVYKAVIPNDFEVSYNQDEVAGVQWMSISEMEAHLKTSPELFAGPFIDLWDCYRDKILAA